jgi:hypothetical protein
MYKILIGRLEGKRPLALPSSGWKNNNKTEVIEILVL